MQMTKEITLPYNFKPREYQLPLFKAIDEGYKRAAVIWHRRAGKDKSLVSLVAKEMFKRVGLYTYYFPTYRQGRDILWEGMDGNGFKFLDHIPEKLRKRTNNQSMTIETINGSLFRIVGTDKPDSLRGGNPIGCVFSEWAEQDPYAWGVVRPILAENGGWAIFNYTPRGKNHGYTTYKLAKDSKDWFCQLLTVDDTNAIPKEVLEQERNEIIETYGDDALYWQEYYCDFEVPVQGAYYAKLLSKMEDEKRIVRTLYDPSLPVDTAWDLGTDSNTDAMAVWFIQTYGKEIRLIDFVQMGGEGLPYFAKVLQERGYVYRTHYAPHDIATKEVGTGNTRLKTARNLGINFTKVDRGNKEDGIEAVRTLLNRTFIDEVNCEKGLSCLRSYHKKYDEKNRTYKEVHDWASHGADALRTFAMGWREKEIKVGVRRERIYVSDKPYGVDGNYL